MPAGSFSNIAALDKHNFLAQTFKERRFVIAVFFLSAVANRRSLMTWGDWDALDSLMRQASQRRVLQFFC